MLQKDMAVIEISPSDNQPLETFRLNRRWTDPKYSVLPDEVLAGIHVLSEPVAATVFDRTSALRQSASIGFASALCDLVDELDVSSTSGNDVRSWLGKYLPRGDEPTLVSWDRTDAVETDSALFRDYWDDFCYPASDDVAIIPPSEECILFYWHDDVFFFGRRNSV